VPRNYLISRWQKENPSAPGEAPREPAAQDLTNMETSVRTEIENLVQKLLPGHVKGADKYKFVEVQFVHTPDSPPIPTPTLANTALAWTSRNWGTLSMTGLAMFSLLMLRSMVKSSPQGTGSGIPSLSLEVRDESDEENRDEGEEESRPRLRLARSHSLKEDLAEIVRGDPDAAANILRTWIGKAA
jgi:flagellar M-ring protein FliF